MEFQPKISVTQDFPYKPFLNLVVSLNILYRKIIEVIIFSRLSRKYQYFLLNRENIENFAELKFRGLMADFVASYVGPSTLSLLQIPTLLILEFFTTPYIPSITALLPLTPRSRQQLLVRNFSVIQTKNSSFNAIISEIFLHLQRDMVKHRMSLLQEGRSLAFHISQKRHAMFLNITLDLITFWQTAPQFFGHIN